MRRTTTTDPADVHTSVKELVEAGLPVGPLELPQPYVRLGANGKLHADRDCSFLRNAYNKQAYVDVDYLTTAPSKLCTKCTSGPSHPATSAYVRHASGVVAARASLRQLRALVLGDTAGHELDPTSEADSQFLAVANDLRAPVTASRATWKRVAQAQALVLALSDIAADTLVHDDMLSYMADVQTSSQALLASLREVANATTDTGALTRSCVLDLMADWETSAYSGNSRAPEDSRPKVFAPSSFPAICTSAYSVRSDGFEELVLEAWREWREEVRAHGDCDAARIAVFAQTKITTLEPKRVEQLSTQVPRTAMPASGLLWDWQVAEWRLLAAEELETIVAEWRDVYTAALADARELPDKVVQISGWAAKDRNSANASNRVLAQVVLELDRARDTALAIVPGIVANWLALFGATGTARKANEHHGSYGRATVTVLRETLPDDSAEMLRTAFGLWAGPKTGFHRSAMSDLKVALTSAQAIHQIV